MTHIFFDLDGTLVDSYPGISYSAGVAVSQVYPNRPPPNFLPYIGPPVRQVFRSSLGEEDPEMLHRLEQAFRRSYDTDGLYKTRVYPGVRAVLGTLRARGVVSYVLTNKPQHATLAILRHLALSDLFADVITPDSRMPLYGSKAEAALEAKRRHGIAATEALVVGDSADDAAAAEACGFQFIAVTFGYGAAHCESRPPVSSRLERFEDLVGIIGRLLPNAQSSLR